MVVKDINVSKNNPKYQKFEEVKKKISPKVAKVLDNFVPSKI